GRNRQLDVRLELLHPGLLALELRDRLLHQLGVQIEADGSDVAALVRTEQVAGAPDLQVVGGDLEPCAQLRELLQYREPLLRVARDPPPRRNEQVRVRALPAPADAAADLVELREPEVVGPVD